MENILLFTSPLLLAITHTCMVYLHYRVEKNRYKDVKTKAPQDPKGQMRHR